MAPLYECLVFTAVAAYQSSSFPEKKEINFQNTIFFQNKFIGFKKSMQ